MSILCLEGDCSEGAANVARMMELYRTIWHTLPDDGPKSVREFNEEFSASVGALKATFDDLNSQWRRDVPFSPVCCEIQRLGLQALEMADRMSRWAGLAPLPRPPLELGLVGSVALIAALLLGASWLLRKEGVI